MIRRSNLRRVGMSAAILAGLALGNATQAALPPDAQNSDDLDVMIAFVYEHRAVLSGLSLIDMDNLSVHWIEWGDVECAAFFTRNVDSKAEPMPGPLPPLVFDHATCPID